MDLHVYEISIDEAYSHRVKNSEAQSQAEPVNMSLKAQCRLLSDVMLRLRNNITIMYFDRYLSCFGIKNSNYFTKFI